MRSCRHGAHSDGVLRTEGLDRSDPSDGERNGHLVWIDDRFRGRPPVWLELQQQGARVTGVIQLPAYGILGSYSGPVDGSVAGDVFSFKEARGAYSGELTVAGDDMVGQIFEPMGKRAATLRRESAATQPDPPKR